MPTDAALRAAIKAHLGRHLGPPGETFFVSANAVKDARVQKVEIPFFLPEQHVRHAVFATIGASAYAMADGGRIEVMAVLAKTPDRGRFDAIHRLLLSAATYAETDRAVLDMGDVIPAKDRLAAVAPAFEAVMLVPPVPVSPDLARCELDDGTRVDLAWLLPLTAAEAAYATRHGPDHLMALFALEHADPTNLERRELDTTRRIPDLETLTALLERAESAPSRAEVTGDVITITRRGGKRRS